MDVPKYLCARCIKCEGICARYDREDKYLTIYNPKVSHKKMMHDMHVKIEDEKQLYNILYTKNLYIRDFHNAEKSDEQFSTVCHKCLENMVEEKLKIMAQQRRDQQNKYGCIFCIVGSLLVICVVYTLFSVGSSIRSRFF